MKKYYENVILITRGILEKQHRNRMSLKREKGRNMNYVGIDIGSTASKVVVEGDKKEHFVLPTGWSSKETCEKIKNKLLEMGVDVTSDDTKVVATGYGRIAVDFADHVITEITCHARGAFFLNPNVRTIIDIGGQDSKVIRIDDTGNVTNFVMNDKCAAGTGRFLELMARTLELSLEQMSEMGLTWKEDITISSMCTVFAESEVVSLIAQDKTAADIIHGLNESVAAKTCALVKRVGGEGDYMMTGGVARNRGVTEALEARLGAPLWLPPEPDLCGALGAALFALDSIQ